IRTLDRGLPADKGTGAATGAGDMPELLWLAPLRSDALLDANRLRQVVAEGLVWADGSSKINPPPAVQELGIENAPAGPWGCKGVAAWPSGSPSRRFAASSSPTATSSC